MKTIMGITNTEIFLMGKVYPGWDSVILDQNGNLHISEFYNQLIAFEDVENVDITRVIDDMFVFENEQPFELFLLYLFGISENQVQPNTVYFSDSKVVANNIHENQNLGGDF